MTDMKERYRGCLLGLAVGDAIGTTVEFRQRGTFPLMTDMVGGGVFRLQAGQWTDDTSMALCLASSLLECRGFDAADQMQRYRRWQQEGYLSSTGHCFDIGNTVSEALNLYGQSGNPFSGPTHPLSAGNGSLMRLAPIPMFYPDIEQVQRYARESSRTTHGAKECLDACAYYATLLHLALTGLDKESVLTTELYQPNTAKIRAIQHQRYRAKSVGQIRGSGYVVDCLEAALWCFDQTDSFADAVLTAANLGDDADTTAAVCGQIAGAYYGSAGIPPTWLARLYQGEMIRNMADGLLHFSVIAASIRL
jgi:ADP-ribosyl-[dinitrogen reductase] hydrolase